MAFAIKPKSGIRMRAFVFASQKTMYGGKQIAAGDTIFVFASENEGGRGLIAHGTVIHAEAVARTSGVARQTPRVSITVRRIARTTRPLGRAELKAFKVWNDGRPETELNFKCSPGYEQDHRHFKRDGGIPGDVLLRSQRCRAPSEFASGSQAPRPFCATFMPAARPPPGTTTSCLILPLLKALRNLL